jgi:hypothetical protein
MRPGTFIQTQLHSNYVIRITKNTLEMAAKDKVYRTIAAITVELAEKLDKVDKGTCSLSEMDGLLADLRELEERIIIIRYKGMERMQYPELKTASIKTKVAEPYRAPELPLDTEYHTEAESKTNELEVSLGEVDQNHEFLEEEVNEVVPNQISLIDSIEEISKEASINERMQNKQKKSVAEQLQSKPLVSVLKALNLNQKMGLVNQVFGGDEQRFKAIMQEIDTANNLEAAQTIVNGVITEAQRDEFSVVRKLDSLIERRFA